MGDGNLSYDRQLVCGHFEFVELFKHPLIIHFPNHIIKHDDDGGFDFSWIKGGLKFLSHTGTTLVW